MASTNQYNVPAISPRDSRADETYLGHATRKARVTRRTALTVAAICISVAAAIGVSGCGQKGPLFLPDSPPSDQAADQPDSNPANVQPESIEQESDPDKKPSNSGATSG